jgi:hypothetical protein
MALQFLPSFGGVAVTLARPEGFASRPAEKRRKISGKRRGNGVSSRWRGI